LLPSGKPAARSFPGCLNAGSAAGNTKSTSKRNAAKRSYPHEPAKDPTLVLYQADDSHPAPGGSYLAACVFYATLLDKSPLGLPAQIMKDGKPLVHVAADEARTLQGIAWHSVHEATRQMRRSPPTREGSRR
jgi:hypothetical protein